MSASVLQLRAAGVLAPLDEQLADTLCRLGDERDERVRLALALLSRQVSQGHVCLPIAELSAGRLSLDLEAETPAFAWPEANAWLAALRASPLCKTEQTEDTSPLVLDAQGRLYLRRHFERERALADDIRSRLAVPSPCDALWLRARLAHYFGDAPNDKQRSAAELALRRSFCVISGGPGTGKTSTVVKILALLVEHAFEQGQPAPRMALMAPTGKAAVRLEEAVRAAKQGLACTQRVRDAIADTATTIHRALRARSFALQRNPGVPAPLLSLDLLLVDEASMIDLELMCELLAAVPVQTKVILLGDRDQLASVEAGAVLGDLCGVVALPGTAAVASLADAVVQLTRSYRYDANSGIDRLARAIQAGDSAAALDVLLDPAHPDVSLCESASRAGLSAELSEAIVRGYEPYLKVSADPELALARFERFRVLCAHRRGAHGVETLNREVARLLYERGLIDQTGGYYPGRPLLITENDYRNRLWNGDLGLVTEDPTTRALSAAFVAPDRSMRKLGFGRLPPHESAYALSVHKSQGSEVDEVALVLPAESSRILSRELLYTAVTRARKRVVIHGDRATLIYAIARRVARSTGLRELLT
jgi:exodeoxyribonuclease V alpha subunit